MGDDRQRRKGADGVNSQKQFFDIGKRLQNEKIDATFFEGERLLVENRKDMLRFRMTRLNADAEWTDGTGDQDFPRGGFASFTGNLNAAAIQALHIVGEAEGASLKRLAPKVLVSMICAPASM